MYRRISIAAIALAVAVVACSDAAASAPHTTPIAAVSQRIVSLSATHTEILYAIGAESHIVATDLTSDFPSAAADTPKVDAFNFNIEEVVALDPDLVVLAFDFSGEVEALRAAGIGSLLLPPPADLAGALDQIGELGSAVGQPEAARTIANGLERDISDALSSISPPSPPATFYHEIDATLFSANSTTFLGSIFSEFGLINLADEVPDEFGSGFVQLSAEFILESDPDVIFLGDAAFGESADTVGARPGWDSLTAVQEGNILELDADISGRWGPRTLQLVRQIAAGLESLQ